MPNEDQTNSSAEYRLPQRDCLAEIQESCVADKSAALGLALHEFNIDARVLMINLRLATTTYEIALAPGVKVAAITDRSNDIMRTLKAESVRILAPLPGNLAALPGTSTVGIEVPNTVKEKARRSDIDAEASQSRLQNALDQIRKVREAINEANVTFQRLRDEAMTATAEAVQHVERASKER